MGRRARSRTSVRCRTLGGRAPGRAPGAKRVTGERSATSALRPSPLASHLYTLPWYRDCPTGRVCDLTTPLASCRRARSRTSIRWSKESMRRSHSSTNSLPQRHVESRPQFSTVSETSGQLICTAAGSTSASKVSTDYGHPTRHWHPVPGGPGAIAAPTATPCDVVVTSSPSGSQSIENGSPRHGRRLPVPAGVERQHLARQPVAHPEPAVVPPRRLTHLDARGEDLGHIAQTDRHTTTHQPDNHMPGLRR
jgi:hypothetical protein